VDAAERKEILSRYVSHSRRFDEVAAVTDRPKGDVEGGFWDFAQGYARLRLGDVDFATLYLGRVQKAAAEAKGVFRMHTAASLLGTVGGILDGEIRRAAGDLPGAIASFERAVALEDALMYDEPEPLPFAARHWLGAALLEARRYADAERVYRDELVDHPHNGWSLIGLQQALKALGRPSAEVDADFAASWSRSDTWIRASRF
jgi:tetratricopeptide (TPR) repeat protein